MSHGLLQSLREIMPRIFVLLFLVTLFPALVAQEELPASSPYDPFPRGGGIQDVDEEVQRLEAAMDEFATAIHPRTMFEALKVLREGFPRSGPVLARAARLGSQRVRVAAIQLLSEKKSPDLDEKLLRFALRDGSKMVRVVALRALSRFEGADSRMLLEYIPVEVEARNRLIAVQLLLTRWGSEEIIPHLVSFLKDEKDPYTQRACIKGLESLSGRGYGADVEAWERYVRDLEFEKQTRELLPTLKKGEDTE